MCHKPNQILRRIFSKYLQIDSKNSHGNEHKITKTAGTRRALISKDSLEL